MAPAKQPSQVFRLATALSAAELVNAAAIFAAVWVKSNLKPNGNPKRRAPPVKRRRQLRELTATMAIALAHRRAPARFFLSTVHGGGRQRRSILIRRTLTNDKYPITERESLGRIVCDGGVQRRMSDRDAGRCSNHPTADMLVGAIPQFDTERQPHRDVVQVRIC